MPPVPEELDVAQVETAPRSPRLDRGSIYLVIGAVSLFLIYLAWQVTGVGGPARRTIIGDTFLLPTDLLVLYATVRAMGRCRADRRRYWSWGFVAAAMSGYLVSDALQGYHEVVRHLSDSPDRTDVIFYVFMFAGLLGFANSRRNVVLRWLFTLDMVTIALSGSAVLWYFLAGPSATSEGHSIHSVVYAIIYPLGDLILLLAAVRTLQRGVPRSSQRAVRTIAAGILTYVAADTIFGYLGLHQGYRGGDLVDVVSVATASLFAVAGALQARATAHEPSPAAARTGSSWMSYGAAAAVFALVFVVQRHESFFPDLTVLGVATVIAIVVATSQLLGQRALTTERTKNEGLVGELRHQAFHDSLTGLANRTLFNERLEHALARRRSLSANHAVLMIDLDGFKSVNDSLGHKAGDELLRTVGDRLTGAVRRGDTVARFGGDEFALLLEDVSGVRDAVELVEHLLGAVRKPMTTAGRTLIPEASIGVALTTEEPLSAEELLRYADAAMYLAKQERTSHYRVFESAMQSALAERVELEADLPGAAGRGELRVFYQPILDLASQEVMGFEALVRWMHPTRGLLQPAAFVPLAETCGLIHEIDTWVLSEATEEASQWQEGNLGRLSVHVNLSPLQLREPDLVDTVREALFAAGLEPTLLTLELVESSVMDDLELAKARLTELKTLGVRIAVDDFGTGYSSLSHLRSLPIDELKIDKSFIAAMKDSVQANTLVRSLIQLGAALGIDTVAEGIEDSEQLLRLQGEECLQGQGYLFARPLARNDVEAYIAEHVSRSVTPTLTR